MEKVRYMISDAANIVNVESHVLRYWEDELELDIPRNEMGHRYYTKENIQEFQRIKELKEQGYQLKAIRMIVHNGPVEGLVAEPQSQPHSSVEEMQHPSTGVAVLGKTRQSIQTRENQQSVLDNTDKMAQFTELMTQIVGTAIAANNQQLSENISEEVGKQVLKEMNYLMREREEQEEERFRKLDAAIRENLRGKEEKKGIFKKKKPSQP
ncbi:MAG: MerR family transcriptional regulator [Clostridiales bacterium]|nr:MerR family transcriptional regulator [Roseburia sp.]MDD7636693.1 MerR family transcriptional regulator [Clostridiales bacterium]MDY4111674.1 MerR family transcriptional regulator [Roseburia sp.]